MPIASFQIDLSRPLSKKGLASFQARQTRLTGAFGASASRAADTFNTRLGAPGRLADGLRIRVPFSCLRVPIAEDAVSDRAAPRRDVRPPATRIVTSQGCALRVFLTALGVAQINAKPGHKFTNPFPIVGDSQNIGWDDLLASGATPSGKGANVAMTRDKKARSIRTALETLGNAGLVYLPGEPGRRGRHEGFVLLSEGGHQHAGEPVRYTVPTAKEDTFVVPVGLLTNGWLNVLEDSEIALLLMVACGRFRLHQLGDDFDLREGEVAISGDDRLRHYGMHRDPFSSARKTLEWFGLLDVREIDRHWEDGRAEGGDTRLHRLRLIPEAFETSGLDVVREVLAEQIARSV